jgi:Na+/H+-dicarboxylate symporter
LAEKVLIGLVVGVAVGIFFGEKAAFLRTAGNAFIMLLQISVIPYVMVSLITALGRLTLEGVKSLGLKAGGVLLVLWGVGIMVVLLAPLAFPKWPSASFFSTSLVHEVEPVDFLKLYIPANPFHSLANAVVPAIVMFSVLAGLALIGVKNKMALIEPLSAASETLLGITGLIARLAPYGIFAIIAGAASSIEIEELRRLQVYVVTYVTLALILSLWLLPALVVAATPIRYGQMIRALRGALITAFATGNVLIVLPILSLASKELMAESGGAIHQSEQSEAESSVDAVIPVALNFPNLGVILSLMFVVFAGWYIGASVPISQYPVLSAAGIASLFGGTVLAIPFLLDLLQLPNDLFQVFLTVDVLGSRFGTLLAVMHIVAIALIGAYALQGRMRLRFGPLARLVCITVVLLAAALIGIRTFYTYVVVAPYTKAQALRNLHLLGRPQPYTVNNEAPTGTEPAGEGPAGLSQIRSRGVLRVCYQPEDYPAAFFNDEDPPQLVGFDIEMAHRFARSVQLPIEFLPADNEMAAAKGLKAGFCDVYMSARTISAGKTERFAMTAPVYRSSVGLIVRDYRRDEFRTWEDARERGASLRLAVSNLPETRELARTLLPEATLLPIIGDTAEQRTILESGAEGIDAIGDLSEEGAAWTLLYPDFSLVVPKPTIFQPVGYAVAPGNEDLLKTLNAWLIAEQAKGAVDKIYKYWMLGEATKTEKPPRWSVIRSVLHWVD